jgi:hypothetical protein
MARPKKIWIRIEVKCWNRNIIETNADLEHCSKMMFLAVLVLH